VNRLCRICESAMYVTYSFMTVNTHGQHAYSSLGSYRIQEHTRSHCGVLPGGEETEFHMVGARFHARDPKVKNNTALIICACHVLRVSDHFGGIFFVKVCCRTGLHKHLQSHWWYTAVIVLLRFFAARVTLWRPREEPRPGPACCQSIPRPLHVQHL